MKERPIIFNGQMVQAIQDGKKTQTRRVIKPQPAEWYWIDGHVTLNWKHTIFNPYEGDPKTKIVAGCPYGQVGDRLWMREKFTLECPYEHADGCGNPDHVIYWAAANTVVRESITTRWRPSIHMPRWASRITLEITSVRVERVKDISFDNALAEGCPIDSLHDTSHGYIGPVAWFAKLWDSINAKRGYSWDANPWVWAITFQRVD